MGADNLISCRGGNGNNHGLEFLRNDGDGVTNTLDLGSSRDDYARGELSGIIMPEG